MFDFHQKRKIRTLINSPYTQGGLLLLVLLVGWSAYVRFDIAMEMRDRRLQAERIAAVLLEKKESLEDRVQYLSDDRGIEAEMRRQFDVALEGEQVVVIVEKQDDDEVIQPLDGVTSTTTKHWYQFWQ